MASPDERQGDNTATTTCYFCHEIPRGASAAVTGLSLRPIEAARSTSSRESAGVAEEESVVPVAGIGDAVLPNDAMAQSVLEPE